MPIPTLLAALPPLLLVPLLPLALAFAGLFSLLPSPSPSSQENRLSLVLDDQKTAVGSVRPASGKAKGVRAVLGPAWGAALVCGGAGTCAYAGVVSGEDDTGALARLAGAMMVLGTLLAGSAPVVLLTPTALAHIFPSCATPSPVRPATPVPAPLTRSKSRVVLLFVALVFACVWNLITTVLAPSIPLPTPVKALAPLLTSLALLLPIPSILLLAPHRPIFVLLIVSLFFGIAAPAFSLARVFAASASSSSDDIGLARVFASTTADGDDTVLTALTIVEAACQLLWLGSLLVCTFALSSTPQPLGAPQAPAYYPSPATAAAYLHPTYKPRATPSPLGIRASPAPSTRTASVIDIGPTGIMGQDEKAGYEYGVVELHDPTALLRAAIMRSFSSSSFASSKKSKSLPSSPSLSGSAGFDISITSSTRAALEAAVQGLDFTLGLPYTPTLPPSAPVPPAPAPQSKRPKTASSLRQTLSRLRLAPRPATAPTPTTLPPAYSSADERASTPAHARTPLCRDGDCTCELGYAYEGFPFAAHAGPGGFEQEGQRQRREWSWVGDLESAEPDLRAGRGEVGVRVEVESASESESEEEGGDGRRGMDLERQ